MVHQSRSVSEYQGTPDAEKVSLASYHLRGEANEWWQWLRRTYAEAGKGVSWEIFSEELWSRFGPTDCEDFDESLSKIRQTGDLVIIKGSLNDWDIDEDDTKAEISLNALTGWSSTGTMRVEIQFNSCQLIVLIDSGSTHNFINEKIAGLLKLPARPTTPFNVKVADGSPLRCTGKFKDIAFSLQGIPFTATFFSLPNGFGLCWVYSGYNN
ncbi:hypothetical protein GH714_017976 [Hevea brasiliensis]|uniref:Retrotransposon gag domain-containing protein n=1 Tax=Hevea brasiliensis TaxID=3981 RepID=A0A6A6MTN5_HEVBR|nr:hypothetical protein GH714_017976 [Hevea brasiliensis]